MGSLRDLSLQPVEDYSSLYDASISGSMTPEQAVASAASLNNPFEAGAKSSIRGAIGGMKGLAAGVMDAYGADPTDMYAAAQHDAELAQALGPRVRSLRDINGLTDALAYGAGQVGTMAPFLAMGVGGGLAGRGINAVTRAGLAPEVAAHLGATGSFVPSMAGEQINQMHELAPEMSADERLARGLITGGAQAVAGAAIPGALLRGGAPAPFWQGLGKQVLAGGAGMAGMDVAGQANRMDYDPNYQFDPMQTGEAAVAGAVGMAPFAVPGAVAGRVGQSGVDVTGKARELLGRGTDAAADVGLEGLKATGRQALDGIKWAGEQAYAAAPEAVQRAFDYLGKGGEMTAEMAEAVKPYASALGEIGKSSLKAYYDGLKEAAGEAKDAYTAGANPLTGLGTRLYGETVKGMGDATRRST